MAIAALRRAARTLARPSPADLATEAGRARDRQRRILLTAVASAGAKAITVLAALVTVPLALHHLGTERYGVWMVLSSFALLLSFADMGLGNGLVNAIAAAYGRDDRAAIRTLVSSGYVALAGIAGVVLAGLAIAWPFVDWPALFNVRGADAVREAGPAVALWIACFALTIPATLVQKVQVAVQQGFVTALWQGVASVATVIVLFLTVRAGGGLPALVAALAGTPLLVSAIASGWFFATAGRDIAPTRAGISGAAMRGAAASGLRFFVLQAIGAVAFGLDPLIVARVAGADAVAGYAVPERMFAVIALVLGIAMQPLWPAYGEAIARGHVAWVRRALATSLLVAGGGALAGSAVLVVFGNDLLLLWVGGAITASPALLLGLGVWKVIDALGVATAMFLNGTNRLGFQIVTGTLAGAAMVATKVWLVGRIGVAGIPWGAALPYLLLSLVPTLVYLRRVTTAAAR